MKLKLFSFKEAKYHQNIPSCNNCLIETGIEETLIDRETNYPESSLKIKYSCTATSKMCLRKSKKGFQKLQADI